MTKAIHFGYAPTFTVTDPLGTMTTKAGEVGPSPGSLTEPPADDRRTALTATLPKCPEPGQEAVARSERRHPLAANPLGGAVDATDPYWSFRGHRTMAEILAEEGWDAPPSTTFRTIGVAHVVAESARKMSERRK